MAQANDEPTAPAPEAHPNLTELIFDVEDDLWTAVDYVNAALQMVEGRGPISADRRSAVVRMIGDAKDKMETVGEAWRELREAAKGDAEEDGDQDDDASASVSPTRENERRIDAAIARCERGEHAAWDIACEMEEPIITVKDYAEVLLMLGSDPTLHPHVAAAITRVARDLKGTAFEVAEWHDKLSHALHPRRGEPGFADDGNGEVEEAAEA